VVWQFWVIDLIRFLAKLFLLLNLQIELGLITLEKLMEDFRSLLSSNLLSAKSGENFKLLKISLVSIISLLLSLYGTIVLYTFFFAEAFENILNFLFFRHCL